LINDQNTMNLSVKEILKKYKIRPTRTLGQNFLIDESVIRRIVDSAEISSGDMVIEVGSGVGNMTRELAARAGGVAAVEIDKRLIPALSESLAEFANVRIFNRDILKTDVGEILEFFGKSGAQVPAVPVKVVANLPYYITTPIIMKFLEECTGIGVLVFMVQKEVADRMCASPGGKDYGALSVAVRYYSEAEKIFNVPPHCFIPQPDVDSTVVRLTVNRTPPVELLDRELFFKTVKASFGQRRKTLVNSLLNSGYFNAGREQIKDILIGLGIDEKQRGETLSVVQFAQLANSLYGVRR
jgi:16S rRNA (adenine1518-N6/adenine1519-N6)-dimethyltransferase